MKNKGFTLAELSIVILIIGLLLGGVALGNSLIDSAKVKSSIVDLGTYRGAVRSFFDKYNGLPGDFLVATTFWSTATNGNGDMTITGAETLQAWNHLFNAGFVTKNYTAGITSVPVIATIQQDPAISAVDANCNSAYFTCLVFITQTASTNYAIPNFVSLLANSMQAKFAYIIDTQIDDGIPNGGNVLVFDKTGSCITVANTVALSTTVGAYTLSCTTYVYLTNIVL